MKSENLFLRTGDALRATGLDSGTWHDAVRRGLFAADPGTSSGQYRRFGRDDLIALAIFHELLGIRVERGHAAGIASDVRTVLRTHPDIETVAVVKRPDATGIPRPVVVVTPPADALILMRFSIAAMRAAADEALTGASS